MMAAMAIMADQEVISLAIRTMDITAGTAMTAVTDIGVKAGAIATGEIAPEGTGTTEAIALTEATDLIGQIGTTIIIQGHARQS